MIETMTKPDFRIYKTAMGGKKGFIDLNDPAALEQLRAEYNNTDILVSTCSYSATDEFAKCLHPLYITVSNPKIDDTRNNAIESIYRLMEVIGITDEQINLYYKAASENDSDTSQKTNDSVEIIIHVDPYIFGNTSTEFMPRICFHLARQFTKNGTNNILIDIYKRNHQINLPNSIIDNSSHYFIPLTFKELIFLSNEQIIEMSKKARPDDSYANIEHNPLAVEWLKQKNDEICESVKKQNILLELIFKTGWQIPHCIQKLQSLCLYDNIRLEAYRIIAAFYSWIKASQQQIWYQIQSVDFRNPPNDYKTLNSIITFAFENPRFVNCENPLLKRFCPAGKCFMFELMEQLKKPYLFK